MLCWSSYKLLLDTEVLLCQSSALLWWCIDFLDAHGVQFAWLSPDTAEQQQNDRWLRKTRMNVFYNVIAKCSKINSSSQFSSYRKLASRWFPTQSLHWYFSLIPNSIFALVFLTDSKLNLCTGVSHWFQTQSLHWCFSLIPNSIFALVFLSDSKLNLCTGVSLWFQTQSLHWCFSQIPDLTFALVFLSDSQSLHWYFSLIPKLTFALVFLADSQSLHRCFSLIPNSIFALVVLADSKLHLCTGVSRWFQT